MEQTYMKEQPILNLLLKMSLPMVVSMLVNSLYNIVDSFFVAKISENAMTALSLVFPVQNLINAVMIGFGIGINAVISFYLGAADQKKADQAASQGMLLGTFHGILLMIICLVVIHPFLSLFTNDAEIVNLGLRYSKIVFLFSVFFAWELVFEKVFQAVGKMNISMICLMSGCLVNIFLDPVLIFGIGPFPVLRVTGAAIATVTAQMIVTVMFFIFAMKDTVLFQYVRYLKKPDLHHLKGIVRIGFPTSVQSMLFTGISMIIARLVAGYGDAAVAVQKVGSQIESISWMTADGFAAAVNSFTSQNHGAGKKRRIYQGYVSALKVVFVWGIFCTLLLICCPAPVFRIFITEKDVIPLGVDYLRILGVSQLFMSLEITTAGAFSGYGKTVPPSVISIVFTALRIPLALILVHTTLALNGIWWSITISSILKGVLLFVWFYIFMRGEKLIYNRK